MSTDAPARNAWKGSPVKCGHCGGDMTTKSEGSAVWGNRWRLRAHAATTVFECARCGHLEFFKT